MSITRFLYIVLLTPLALLIAACNQTSSLPNAPSTEENTTNSEMQKDSEEVAPSSPDNIIVVGGTDNYPENCSPREVAALVLRFFTAYNGGNQEQLASFFEPHLSVHGQAGWYSDTIMTGDVGSENDRRHFVTFGREELLAYFSNRHDQKERLQLLSLNVSPPTSVTRVDVSYTYKRQGDDIEPGPNGVWRMGDGKGVIKCPSLKIGIWSMGTSAPLEDEDDYMGACDGSRIIPGKSDAPENVVIACTRGLAVSRQFGQRPLLVPQLAQE